MIFNRHRISLRPDTFYVIPPETPFGSGSTRPFEKLFVHFVLPPLIRTREPAVWRLPASPEKVENCLQCAVALQGSEPHHFQAGHRAALLAHWAIAELPAGAFIQGIKDERMAAAIRLFQTSFPGPVPNDHLATAVGMNTNAFIRVFRQTFGEPPQSYYTRFRIDQACRMLHGGDDSIDQIAAATGFCDRYHFSRVFQKLRGMGPASFRKIRDAVVI